MQKTNGRKSSNLVKSQELICHFIRGYLVPLTSTLLIKALSSRCRKLQLFCFFQVCIKLNHPDRSYFNQPGLWSKKWYNVYHYDDNAVGETFRVSESILSISEKSVKKARETLKAYQVELEEFDSKLLRTKRQSMDSYLKMIEGLGNMKDNTMFTSRQSDLTASKVPYDSILNKIQLDFHEKMDENREKFQSNLVMFQESIQNSMKELQESIQKIPK